MQILVKGKQVDVGEALRGYVEDRLTNGVAKYFDNAIDANVVFSREGPMFRADCAVHVGAGISVQSHAKSENAHACFDAAAERLEKRLRRYKRRLRDHRNNQKAHFVEAIEAQSYVLAASSEDGEEEPQDLKPIIVAERTTEIPTVTVGEAVMRLDLADSPALMFRNRAHGGLNVVYRRPDGNIGWIDPQEPKPKA